MPVLLKLTILLGRSLIEGDGHQAMKFGLKEFGFQSTRNRVLRGVAGALLVSLFPLGCRHSRDLGVDLEMLERIQANPNSTDPTIYNGDSLLEKPPKEIAANQILSKGRSVPAENLQPVPGGESDPKAKRDPLSGTNPPANHTPAANTAQNPERVLNLEDAISEAFRNQPRLKAQLESIEQSKQGENIAFAPFLPVVSTGYSVGQYGVGVGGVGIPVPGGGAFNFLPPGGVIPIGFNFSTGFELAEFRVQWLVTDFGKRLGRYKQAGIASEVVQLQTTRAYQTVANEVAMAYYQVLRAQAIRKVTDASVARCTEEVEQSEKLAKEDALEREGVLRAKVQLATALKLQDSAQASEQISQASLNLAIGNRVSDPVQVDSLIDLPGFNQSLAQCLEQAVAGRREFSVARRTIDSAQEGKGIARADFAPKIIADGFYLDYHQNKPGGYVDIPIGTIKLEWALFEGGKRIAELRQADSRIRAAMAQADSLTDTIAFQVNEAYRQLVVSRRAIERSKAPVEQTRETYRIVKARARQGDASPSEVIEAETSMTRAEYEYQTSLFDYLMGLAKLEYAMGTSPESETNLRAKPRAVENSSTTRSAGEAKNLSQEAIP